MISVDHGIEIRDNCNNVIITSKMLDEQLSQTDYYNRNKKYWFDEQYWSRTHPICPAEISLSIDEILTKFGVEIDDMAIYNFYHYIKITSTY